MQQLQGQQQKLLQNERLLQRRRQKQQQIKLLLMRWLKKLDREILQQLQLRLPGQQQQLVKQPRRQQLQKD